MLRVHSLRGLVSCSVGACALAALAPAAASAALFTDDFETGVHSSTWALVTAGQNILDGDTGGHHLDTQSAKQVNAFSNGVSDVYNMKTQVSAFTNPGPILAGTKEVATVQ